MLNVVLYIKSYSFAIHLSFLANAMYRYTMYNGMEPHNFASSATQTIYFLLENGVMLMNRIFKILFGKKLNCINSTYRLFFLALLFVDLK